MRLQSLILPVLCLLTLGPARAGNIPDLTSPVPLDSAVTAGTLPNGLRYFIRANRKPEHRAELRLVVNAGSVLENDDQRGIAHFCEHMAFNGTTHFRKQELVNYMESIGMRFGADLNAYTSFDETVYMLKVPTDTPAIVQKGFQILEDWAHNVSYDDDEIEKERGVVIEEWRIGRGAAARMRDKQFPIVFKDSRYAERLTIGDKHTLETCSHETLRDFYRTWYRPELMSVVAVGDFQAADIEALIRTHFSGIPPSSGKPGRTLYPVPDNREVLFAIASDSEATSSQVSVYYKHAVEPSGSTADYRRSLVEGLYNAMLNSRLNELTHKADPPFLYGYSGNGRLVRTKGVYYLGAGVDDNGIERGLRSLLEEADRVSRFGFTATELEREKRETLRGYESAYAERDKTESDNYAEELVRHVLDDEPVPGIAWELGLVRQLLPAVSIDDVDSLTHRWITPDNRVVLVNVPDKAGVEVPTPAKLSSVFEEASAAKVQPYVDSVGGQSLISRPPEPGSIIRRTELDDLGVTEWELSNGARVVLKPTDFKNDQILFSAQSPGGTSLVADSDFVPANSASGIVQQSGIGQFDATQLDKVLAGKIAHVSSGIGETEEGLSGSAAPADMETLFQLIYLYLTSPRTDSGAYLAYREKVKAFLDHRGAQPEAVFNDTVQTTMTQYHPRRLPWTPAILEKFDLNRSVALYRERFADAGGFTFLFVGNFTLPAIEPLVCTYLAGLPSRTPHETWKDIGVMPPSGEIAKTVKRGIEPKSQARMMFTGPFVWSRENRYAIQSLASVLNIRLREILREDKGGTYGVGVAPAPVHYPRERYTMTISFGCAPERVDELVKAALEAVDSLKRFGPADSYIQKVKEIQKRERETSLKQNGFWLGSLQSAYMNHEDPHKILKYDELVDHLSADVIREAASRYFDMKNYAKFVLMPKGTE